MQKWILDDDGNVIPFDSKIANTKVGKANVSTVFLALDHAWLFGGPPLLFETMVFGGPLDQEQTRHTTRAKALTGHAAMVERVKRYQGKLEPK